MHLAEFARAAESCRENGHGFATFRTMPEAVTLRWPDDVLEQWLYDHANNDHFLRDYGSIDLITITWSVEAIPLEELIDTPTGASDADCIDYYATDPAHWIRVRNLGVHQGVALSWETHGTWKRWPILIDRSLLDPSANGLQVVEGRTRVGVLKGRHREGSLVAPKHLAWVGRSVSQETNLCD